MEVSIGLLVTSEERKQCKFSHSPNVNREQLKLFAILIVSLCKLYDNRNSENYMIFAHAFWLFQPLNMISCLLFY